MCPSQAVLLAGLLLARDPGRNMTDRHQDYGRRIENFLDRAGFSRLDHLTGIDGVSASWDQLRNTLSGRVRPLRPHHFATHPLESGLVEADWNWQRGDHYLSISLFVSGAGFAKVHQRLRSL